MFIQTCKKKQSLMITCMSNHTINAKYTKYMHLGTILWGTSVKYSRHIGNMMQITL